ncbi:hypothetical protein D3C73_982110 [compost metagenome]
MSGNHHVVEDRDTALRIADFDGSGQPADLLHRCRKPDAIGKAADHARHIFPAAAGDRAPGGAIPQFEKPMIAAEFDEAGGRIGTDLHGRCRPDRRRHRIEMIVAKGSAIAVAVQIIVQGNAAHHREIARRATIEPQEIPHHRPEARIDEIGFLSKQPKAGTA